MTGLLIQLLLSWLLIRLIEKKDLGVLGLRPDAQRMKYAGLLLLVTALCCTSGYLLRMYFGKERFALNPVLNMSVVDKGLWKNLNSVLFEELIFRGVLLYILIRRLGQGKAIVLSALAFAAWHWFNLGAFGNIPQMLSLLLYTGSMGLLLAYAYARSFSLYLPVAIHFGWNIVQNFVFSEGPFGRGLFVPVLPRPQVDASFFIYCVVAFLPMIAMLVLDYMVVKRYPARKK